MIEKHFKNLYDDNIDNHKIKNNHIFDFEPDIEYALGNLSKGKAWGLDGIPDDVFKNESTKNSIIFKLKDAFLHFLILGKIPYYLMTAKLILFSKDGSNTPIIDKIRPIGVLTAITKLFELSIINKLNKWIEYPNFNKQQRGFIKGKSTKDNIAELLKFGREMQERRKYNKTIAAFVFFDLKNAYDRVPRDFLINKFEEFNLPWNVTAVIKKNMLEIF